MKFELTGTIGGNGVSGRCAMNGSVLLADDISKSLPKNVGLGFLPLVRGLPPLHSNRKIHQNSRYNAQNTLYFLSNKQDIRK